MSDLSKVKVKYDHWFAPMIPFIKKKNVLYGKVFRNTIYYSHPKSLVLRKNPDGTYRFKRLMRHELEHIYQNQKEGVFPHLMRYFGYYIRNLFKYWNFKKAYLQVPYEIEARAVEHLEMTPEELAVYERS